MEEQNLSLYTYLYGYGYDIMIVWMEENGETLLSAPAFHPSSAPAQPPPPGIAIAIAIANPLERYWRDQ